MTDAPQQPPTSYAPTPPEWARWLAILFTLVGLVVGPALAVGVDYLYWLSQPPAAGEGGYAELVYFVTSLYCCGFFGLVVGILGGWWAGRALGQKITGRTKAPPNA